MSEKRMAMAACDPDPILVADADVDQRGYGGGLLPALAGRLGVRLSRTGPPAPHA